MWIQTLGLPHQKKILMLCGYRQWKTVSGGQEARRISAQIERWNKMLTTWDNALSEDKETIMMLDANINALNWTELNKPETDPYDVQLKPLVEALFEKILPQGITMLIKQPTHHWRGKATRALDHIYTNNPEKASEAEVIWTGMSDHALVKFKRYTRKLDKKPRYVRKRTFKKFEVKQYREMVRAMPELKDIMETQDANQAAEILTRGLTGILDKLAPLKTIQTRAKYAPHLSEETKELMKRRNEAQKVAAMSGCPDEAREAKHLRNRVVDSRREDRKKWEKQKLNSEGKSPEEVWKGVKGILGWGDAGPPTRLFHEGKFINTPKALATTMNKFFWTKVDRLRKQIPISPQDPLFRIREKMAGKQEQFQFKQVTVEEMGKTLQKLKTSSSTGVDWIDSNCLKVVADIIAPAMTHITNLSITTNTFPNIYKQSKIVPLKKSPELSDMSCSSYRPVNLLPVLGKVLERATFSQITEYLETNELLHHNHHGGRRGHSTGTALIQMYDKWVEEIEEGKLVGVLMIDQSAAFDLCDHVILTGKVNLLLGGAEGVG